MSDISVQATQSLVWFSDKLGWTKMKRRYLRNGGKPHRRMYVMTPAAQMSTFRPYLRSPETVTQMLRVLRIAIGESEDQNSPRLCDNFRSHVSWSPTHGKQRPVHHSGQTKVPQFQRLGAVRTLKHLKAEQEPG